MTWAQVTQHLQLELPPAWPTGYNIPRAAGRRAKGFGSLAQPQEAQRGRPGMPLLGFQKLLQFLELQQLLEWAPGQSDPCPDPLPNAGSHKHAQGSRPPRMVPCALGLLRALETGENPQRWPWA